MVQDSDLKTTFSWWEKRRNNKRLRALKNTHQGKRAFIIGNGPSLRIADLDKLSGELTFASNRIYLAFVETAWRPTYYTMCDEVVARNDLGAIRALQLKKVFAHSVRKYLWDISGAVFVNPEPGPELGGATEWDLVRGTNAGHSVINLGIKIAWWMGIRELYVIGADHDFVVPDEKTGEIAAHNEVIVSAGEQNHFHPEYRRPGETWTMPQLDVMEEEFGQARRVLESSGGFIKNASRKSKLQCWERVNFDDLF